MAQCLFVDNLLKESKMVKSLLVLLMLFGLSSAQMATAGVTVMECTGTVKSVDATKTEVAFLPAGATDAVRIKVDASWARELKAGDIIKVTYEKKEVNTATSVQKLRAGFKLPIPPSCTKKMLE